MRLPFDEDFFFCEDAALQSLLFQKPVISVLRREKYLGRLLTRGRQKCAPEKSKKAFNGILRNKCLF